MIILQFGFVILLILMMWMLILFLERFNRQAVHRNLTSKGNELDTSSPAVLPAGGEQNNAPFRTRIDLYKMELQPALCHQRQSRSQRYLPYNRTSLSEEQHAYIL